MIDILVSAKAGSPPDSGAGFAADILGRRTLLLVQHSGWILLRARWLRFRHASRNIMITVTLSPYPKLVPPTTSSADFSAAIRLGKGLPPPSCRTCPAHNPNSLAARRADEGTFSRSIDSLSGISFSFYWERPSAGQDFPLGAV